MHLMLYCQAPGPGIDLSNLVTNLFEGGYLDSDQFSLLHFSLCMGGGRVLREIMPNSLYSLLFYFERFPICFSSYSLRQCYNEHSNIFENSQEYQYSSLIYCHFQNPNKIQIFDYFCPNIAGYFGNISSENTLNKGIFDAIMSTNFI